MPAYIDLYFFRYHLEGAQGAYRRLTLATEAVRRIQKLVRDEAEKMVKQVRATGDPSPLVRILLDLQIDNTNREVIARATYVYAWVAFLDLLAGCVEAVFLKSPSRMLAPPSSKKRKRGDDEHVARLGRSAVRRLLLERASANEIVNGIVQEQVGGFRKSDYPTFPQYFRRRLAIDWLAEWTTALARPHERRTQAAHSFAFEVPPADEVTEDLQAIERTGEAIARACAEKHQLQVRTNFVDPTIPGLEAPTRLAGR